MTNGNDVHSGNFIYELDKFNFVGGGGVVMKFISNEKDVFQKQDIPKNQSVNEIK